MMKRVLLLCLVLFSAGCSLPIISKDEIVSHAYSSHQLPDDWQVVQDEEGDLVVLLFYSKDYSNHAHAIYQRQGLGYHCISSGYYLENSEIVLGDYDKDYHIYASLNKKRINRYELYNNCDVSKGAIDANKPFVIIFPSDAGEITFYTNDQPIYAVEG